MNVSSPSKLVILLLAWISVSSTFAVPIEGGQMTVGMRTGRELHKRRANKSGVENKVPWHLDRIDQRQLPLDSTYTPSGNGSGVDIYIFAEGIQYGHKAFDGRASNGGFAPDQKCTRIGTELASLAAGEFVGVATGAHVYSINVLECQLYTSAKRATEALDHVIQKTKNNTEDRRSIIVLPLVGRNSPDFNAVVKQAVDNNIVVVTPAGNHLDDACKYSPGNSPSVINVGATQKNDKLYRYSTRGSNSFGGSNFGDCVSLYAPGHSIIAADENYGYSKISGTHAACGIVAGAAALVLEKHKDYTPAEVKQHLLSEATDGVVEMPRAFDMLLNRDVNKFLYVGNDSDDEFSANGDKNDSSEGNALSTTK